MFFFEISLLRSYFVFFTIFRQEIFARERLNILQKHADDIIGFLPHDLLQSACL